MEGEGQSFAWSRSVSVHPHRSHGCRFETQGLRKTFLLSMQGQDMLQGLMNAPGIDGCPGIFQGWPSWPVGAKGLTRVGQGPSAPDVLVGRGCLGHTERSPPLLSPLPHSLPLAHSKP